MTRLPEPAPTAELLAERYAAVRGATEDLCRPLEVEDYVIQSMPDASPAKWHLAHTTWFFETFILARRCGYESPEPAFHLLFNSYYNSLGAQHSRPDRGKLSRPTVAQVYEYRRRVDDAVLAEIRGLGGDAGELLPLLELGLHHEQQHQELILTDVKHMLAQNPLSPVYARAPETPEPSQTEGRWLHIDEGLYEIGRDDRRAGAAGFSFDNEGPRHRVFLEAFELRSRLVTGGDLLEFIADGGYREPSLWLSDGWATAQREGWRAPLYWHPEDDGSWSQFTLAGKRPVAPTEPVCHLSFFEADAFARWAGARLPSEAEWEVAAQQALPSEAFERARGRANLAATGRFHPRPLARGTEDDLQLLGDVWEWTRSAYAPYPGFTPPDGALGEYNAKFMNNQTVLRGGSCATPASHIRLSYRNFFPSHARWQWSGLRLAKDAG
ncbi:MAG: ergothioneine biosynthesis protein EgtB [Acidobacteriota bacterium]